MRPFSRFDELFTDLLYPPHFLNLFPTKHSYQAKSPVSNQILFRNFQVIPYHLFPLVATDLSILFLVHFSWALGYDLLNLETFPCFKRVFRWLPVSSTLFKSLPTNILMLIMWTLLLLNKFFQAIPWHLFPRVTADILILFPLRNSWSLPPSLTKIVPQCSSSCNDSIKSCK